MPGRSAAHQRARELAALRLDEPLAPADAAWLEEHLAACEACAAAADGYAADHLLFGRLRDAAPVPPRDLWARTAAAIDAEQGARGSALARRRTWRPLTSLAPIAGLAVVAVLVGTALLTGTPGNSGVAGSPAATAFALSPGQIAVVTRGADGRLQVLSAGVDEVCPLVADRCEAATPSFETAPLAWRDAHGRMDAILSPHRDRIVVVQRNAGGSDGVYVVPVRPSTGGGAATGPTSTGAPGETATAASPTPSSAAGTPATGPGDASGSPEVPASPGVEPSPSASPAEASPPEGPAGSEAPEVTATPQDTPAPTVGVTPAPDGAIEIARDVVVVGSVAEYDDDGGRFAFTARPADGSAGPDVYVWDTADTQAVRVTGDHRSVFAGWDGKDLLVSRVVDGEPRTASVNPRTGEVRPGTAHGVWLPAVSPDGTQAVWWDGAVELAPDGVTWVPAKGRLVMGPWPDGAGDVRVVARRAPASWQVRWADDGSAIAVWTAGDDEDSGSLSLYAVDPQSGRVNLSKPLLRDEPAMAGFSVEAGRLVYAVPEKGGQRGAWVFVWDGGSTGKVRLPGDTEITVIR